MPSQTPPFPRPPRDEHHLVVATYNIHRAIGADGLADPGRVAAVLREIDADVVALQEVGASEAAGTDALVERLADAAGAFATRGYTLSDARGDYGNVLLTRRAPDRIERLDLTVEGNEPRGAIVATIEQAGRALRIVATHLGLRSRERRVQAEQLARWLAAQEPEHATVLLGDVNEWRPRAATLRILERQLGRAPRPATFPTRRPLFALDRVFARPGPSLDSVHVHRSPLARRASDHLPVVARINLEPPRATLSTR
jgi:endonuclease/exonuclease/phosphatase family metal-dependent hydrolase